MRNIKLTLAYDGSEFHGWQIQPGVPTVQGVLAETARQITQEKIYILGASRTDSGVHALGQVANFKTKSQLSAAEFQRALNALLPPSVRVMRAEEIGPDFHARWQSQAKTYRYRIFRGPVASPFDRKFVLHYPYSLDEGAMARAARLFEGQHDFSSFAASSGAEEGDRDRNMVRMIYRSELIRRPAAPAGTAAAAEGEGSAAEVKTARLQTAGGSATPESQRGALCGNYLLDYEVRGQSFLRYMVRKIVGTLLEIGRGRLSPEDLPALFELRDRSRSGPTAPPDGLCLVSIEYSDPLDWLNTREPKIG